MYCDQFKRKIQSSTFNIEEDLGKKFNFTEKVPCSSWQQQILDDSTEIKRWLVTLKVSMIYFGLSTFRFPIPLFVNIQKKDSDLYFQIIKMISASNSI